MRWSAPLLLLLCGVAPAAESPVHELFERLTQAQQRERTALARELASSPPSELVELVGDLEELRDTEAEQALVEALQRTDVDALIGTFEGIAGTWKRHRATVERFYALLRESRAPIEFEPALLESMDELPTELVQVLDVEAPVVVGSAVLQPSAGSAGLEFELLGCKLDVKRLRTDRATRVRVTPTDFGEPTALWFRHDGSRWTFAPAALGRVETEGGTIDLLDADLDGRFDGEADLVRSDGGAFRPWSDRIWSGGSSYLASRSPAGLTLVELAATPAASHAHAAWRRVNEWRATTGLPPLRLDLERTRACELHVDYWKANGFSGHDQDPTKPRYTREGARAGQNSSVMAGGSAAGLVDRIHPTILHRITLIGAPRGGMGAADDPGALIWASRPDASPLGRPLVVPAPGQLDVPSKLLSESPLPDHDPHYYDRPHGYPVSATLTGLSGPWRDLGLTLVEAEQPDEPIAGEVFSAERPYSKLRAGNYDTVYFVADRPLELGKRYRARFTATRGGEPYTYEWEFTTF